MSDKKKRYKTLPFCCRNTTYFLCIFFINSKAIKAFVLSFFPVTKKIVIISWILLTNTANMSPSNRCHYFLIVFVFLSFLFSFLVSLSVPRIDDWGVEIAIKTTISHVVFLFCIRCYIYNVGEHNFNFNKRYFFVVFFLEGPLIENTVPYVQYLSFW